jgi:hypothetical protein
MAMLNGVRKVYHEAICTELIAYRNGPDVLGFSDGLGAAGIELGRRLVSKLGFRIGGKKLSSDAVGQRFAELTREFIHQGLTILGRPMTGGWIVSTSGMEACMDAFGRHTALPEIQRVFAAYPQLRAELDRYCLIAPDIIVARRVGCAELANREREPSLEEKDVERATPSRKGITQACLLHAAISCNWTARGNREQRAPIEVLNLLRGRRGNTPHTMVVTFEALPTRLASLTLGAGDLDCMYHVALDELIEAVGETGSGDQKEVIGALIQDRRLRDISDLPLDLAA